MSTRQRIEHELRSITPGVAKSLLESSPQNRPISNYWIDRWRREMQNDEWTVADPILLDENGCLLDGHHRLRAVVLLDRPIKFLVIKGIIREQYWSKGNRQRVRTAGHALAERGVTNYNAVAGAAYRIVCWELGIRPPLPTQLGYGKRPSDNKIVLAATEDTRIVELMEEMPRARGLLALGCQGFLFWLFCKADMTHAKCFFSDLASGESLPAGDPALILRNKLIAAKLECQSKRTKINEGVVMAWTIKAWNASITDSKLASNSLRWNRGSPFPEPTQFKKQSK